MKSVEFSRSGRQGRSKVNWGWSGVHRQPHGQGPQEFRSDLPDRASC